MRASLLLAIAGAWAFTAIAGAQTSAATQPPGTGQTASQPDAARPADAPAREPAAAHPLRRAHAAGARVRHGSGSAHASSPGDKGGGVLSLGATDITGNKELPKVMVVVPWKDSLGAGGVIKPTDSLLDEVLQPVDRGVFQRQVRYYGELGAGAPAGQAPESRVPDPARPRQTAPVGDNR